MTQLTSEIAEDIQMLANWFTDNGHSESFFICKNAAERVEAWLSTYNPRTL